MKLVFICLIFFAGGAAPLLAAQDAATEVMEGDVKHWIEYYKKERGLSNGTVTEDKATPEAAPEEAGDGGADVPPTQPDRPDPVR